MSVYHKRPAILEHESLQEVNCDIQSYKANLAPILAGREQDLKRKQSYITCRSIADLRYELTCRMHSISVTLYHSLLSDLLHGSLTDSSRRALIPVE